MRTTGLVVKIIVIYILVVSVPYSFICTMLSLHWGYNTGGNADFLIMSLATKQTGILVYFCPFGPILCTRYSMTRTLNKDQTCTIDTAHKLLHLNKFLRWGVNVQSHKVMYTEVLLNAWVLEDWVNECEPNLYYRCCMNSSTSD